MDCQKCRETVDTEFEEAKGPECVANAAVGCV